MLKRKNKIGFASDSDFTENESSFTSKPRSIISITKQNSYKTGLSHINTPPYRGHARISFQQDPNFMKLMPRDISVDKERLIDDNLAFKSKTSLIIEENTRLKSRLVELQNEQNNEINTNKVQKIKNKIRDLQSDLQKKKENISTLKKNLRSCKISEKQNEIESYINEAAKLAYLLERLLDQQNPVNSESNNETVSVGYELQALRKENIELNQLLNQTSDELNSLRSKLLALEKKKKKQNSKTLLKKLKAELSGLEKTFSDNVNTHESRQKELADFIQLNRNIGAEKLKELDEAEQRYKRQEELIKDMRMKYNLKKSDFAKRRTSALHPKRNSDLDVAKLDNPPRLFVKINQILNKKKMLMSVFLSLLDKNNNGMINLETFMNKVKEYGKRIKRKHLDEVFQLIGSTLNYIPVVKLDELYETYRFEGDYNTSSDEEVKSPKKPEKIEKKIPSPEPKKETIEIKKTPLLEPIKAKEVIVKSIPVVKITDIHKILLEIRIKMMAFKLLKNKLIQTLFGTSFDPDDSINFSVLYDYFSKSVLNLRNKEDIKLLTRFLLEPEGVSTITENDSAKAADTIRNISKKLQKVLPDWEIFSEAESEEFENFLKKTIPKIRQELLELCIEKDTLSEGKVAAEDFIGLCKKLSIEISESLNDWFLIKFFLLGWDQVFYSEFLNQFIYEEPLIVKPVGTGSNDMTKEEKALVIDDFLRKVVQKINFLQKSFFPLNDLGMNVDDFLQILKKMDLEIPLNHLEVVIEKFCFENKDFIKQISLSQFLQALKDYGMNIEADNYIDEEFPSKFEGHEEDKYSDSFESSKLIEEAIQEQIENETELEFIEYGIKIESK